MESLCELQNPLLDKTNKHMVGDDYGYQGDFPPNQCQKNIISYFVTGGDSCQAKAHQLLDATSLHLAVEAFYRPNFILCKDNVQAKSKDCKGENCETTFTEDKEAEPETGSTEDPQAKLLGEKEVKIQTVSYDVEEEEYLEYEVRGCGMWGVGRKHNEIWIWTPASYSSIDYLDKCITSQLKAKLALGQWRYF